MTRVRCLSPRNRLYGFTLLELIVVITIIGILGTFVVMNVAGSTEQARRTKMKNDCKAIHSAAEVLKAQSGYWPKAIEELVNPQTEEGFPMAGGLKEMPKDPWGNEYLYELGDDGPIVTCLGADANYGGEGDALDYSYPEESDYEY